MGNDRCACCTQPAAEDVGSWALIADRYCEWVDVLETFPDEAAAQAACDSSAECQTIYAARSDGDGMLSPMTQ